MPSAWWTSIPDAPVLLMAVPSERWRRTGEKNRLEGEGWRRTRESVLQRARYRCESCGFSSPLHLQIHHKGGAHDDDRQENLVALCPLCHCCCHIGFAGVRRLGSLVAAPGAPEQKIVNRGVLEMARTKGVRGAVDWLASIPVRKNYGPLGLVETANLLLETAAKTGQACAANPDLRFIPFPEAFPIVAWLARQRGETQVKSADPRNY